MPWPLISLRDRRRQVRDDVATHLPGADATVPNSNLRVMSDAMAALAHDNDLHLDWVARMMMPDTAEGEFADRWGNIILERGRKAASPATGQITVTGDAGSAVPSGAELTAPAIDADGVATTLRFEVSTGVTLVSASAVVSVVALTNGALGNLEEGAVLAFVTPPAGIDGSATVAAPGFTAGADQETDAELIARYIARLQEPPHGGARHDYVAWALEVPGVTRAWAAQEMGIGTVTVRFMMDDAHAEDEGIPESEDVDLVADYIDALRPVTVADFFVVAPIAQPLSFTITLIANDTPETRANVETEIRAMLKQRAAPGQTIYASWIREAISAATGEDYHNTAVGNQVPSTAGHIIVPGTITFS